MNATTYTRPPEPRYRRCHSLQDEVIVDVVTAVAYLLYGAMLLGAVVSLIASLEQGKWAGLWLPSFYLPLLIIGVSWILQDEGANPHTMSELRAPAWVLLILSWLTGISLTLAEIGG